MRLCVVGGGRMGTALVQGLLANGWIESHEISISEVLETRRIELGELLPGVLISSTPVAADGVILATKPDRVAAAAAAVRAAGTQRVLSIAAGVRIENIQRALGGEIPVVRAMPNTPALVGKGASAICASPNASEEDLTWAEAILASVGIVVRVEEVSLDAVTGLSGSGPAYVFLLVEAMIEAGVAVGLEREVSTLLAIQTLVGSAALLANGESPAQLRAMVTSPGGTTAAGVSVLEAAGLRALFVEAIAAATSRSRELGAS